VKDITVITGTQSNTRQVEIQPTITLDSYSFYSSYHSMTVYALTKVPLTIPLTLHSHATRFTLLVASVRMSGDEDCSIHRRGGGRRGVLDHYSGVSTANEEGMTIREGSDIAVMKGGKGGVRGRRRENVMVSKTKTVLTLSPKATYQFLTSLTWTLSPPCNPQRQLSSLRRVCVRWCFRQSLWVLCVS
jgi:hypothetical protein